MVSKKTYIFNKQKWRAALNIQDVEVCDQATRDREGVSRSVLEVEDVSSSRPQIRPVEVHCVEAVPDNAERLKEAAKVTGVDQHGFFVSDLAIAGPDTPSVVSFPNNFELGAEGSNLADCNRPGGLTEKQKKAFTCKDVQTVTIDKYVKNYVDRDGVPKKRGIPFLRIDLEGFD